MLRPYSATVTRFFPLDFDSFTAACSPHIYRATLLGKDFDGNAFACEATSNLVRRSIITEKDGILTAKNACEALDERRVA